MFPYTFKPEVYDDVKIAFDWYESQRQGLGEDFLLGTSKNVFQPMRQKSTQPTKWALPAFTASLRSDRFGFEAANDKQLSFAWRLSHLRLPEYWLKKMSF